MSLQCGIVGMPNVGKSTLFNALTSSVSAQAQNYPFCTIQPNFGIVSVPDERLHKLAEIAGSAKLIPATVEFVDIAGLVKGASEGEGLGNEFLGHIRGVDAIAYVVRCFEDDDIMHVDGSIDPTRDIDTIKTELVLADIGSLEKRIPKLEKKARGNKELERELALMKDIYSTLNSGGTLEKFLDEDPEAVKKLQLLSSKPFFYICNTDEKSLKQGNAHSAAVVDIAKKEKTIAINVSAQIESEIAQIPEANEREEFLKDMGLLESGLNKVIKTAYSILDLQTFFTIGPKEAHAWTIKSGTMAPQAAGTIHKDFEKGFIRAEIISYDDYIEYGSELKAREGGKMKLEGQKYIMKDGDIVHFRFNV